MKKQQVIVIGAGAAGLMAAGTAAELGLSVLLIEKMERPGRKLLITGKGRCNITNNASQSEFLKHIFPNSRFLKHAFAEYFSDNVVEMFRAAGVETVVERGERIFPKSNLAADVVEALKTRCRKAGVVVLTHSRVLKLLVKDGAIEGVTVETPQGKEDLLADNVIVCTGGNSYPATGSSGDGYRLATDVGHSISKVLPALVPLVTEGSLASDLQGLSLKNVKASVWVNGKKQIDEFGEMLFTHFGLSGPIILTLSRFVVIELDKGNKVEISIDLKPALDEQKLDARLLRDINEHGKKLFENLFREWLPSKMIPVFFQISGIDPAKQAHQISSKERRKVMLLMKDFRFKVTGHRSFKEAIVTSGGIPTTEIDSKTMESKLVKGLYFAGEVIDLDADTGGYNLQIAWSTGWLAGFSAAQRCKTSSLG